MEIAPEGESDALRAAATPPLFYLRRAVARRGELLIRHQPDHDDERAGQRPVQPADAAGAGAPSRPVRRRKLMYPRKEKRNRKAENEQQENRAPNPGGQVQYRRHIGSKLEEHPGDDRIGGSDAKDVAPLQFREEVGHLKHPSRAARRDSTVFKMALGTCVLSNMIAFLVLRISL